MAGIFEKAQKRTPANTYELKTTAIRVKKNRKLGDIVAGISVAGISVAGNERFGNQRIP